jgi:hypothetical protein
VVDVDVETGIAVVLIALRLHYMLLLMLVLGFLKYKHWISVNWTVAENQSNVIMTHVANRIAAVTQHMNHEIPIGLLGFAPGVAIGFYKG